MLAKNTRMPVVNLATALIVGAMVALWLALLPAPAQAQPGDVLHLQSIKCVQITGDEWDFTDEAYLTIDGTRVWSGSMQALQVQNLTGISAPLSGQSARIQLWERDDGFFNAPDDGPAERFVEYTGGGEKTSEFYFYGSGFYKITYRVERPDTVSPDTVIDSGPSGPTADNTPTFTFSGSDDVTPPWYLAFSYKVDNGDWSPLQAGTNTATTSGLSDGPHIFFVKSKDPAGNEDATPAQRSFAVDTVNPMVTSTIPPPTATRVDPGVNITAAFSEDMDASTINGSTFKLFKVNSDGTETQITDVVVSYDPTTKKATLNPNANLRRGAKYKAEVSTGAKDLAGNQLDQDQDPNNGNQPKQWTFTTGPK